MRRNAVSCDAPFTELLSLGDIQREEARLLAEFSQICEKYGCRWWLAYGSCLGAVRHGGPIPWDDDADVVMPRPDYERLLSLLPSGTDCRMLDVSAPDYPWSYGKFVSTKTVFREYKVRAPDGYGVFVDVFPLDGVPASGGEGRYRKVWLLSRIAQYAHYYDFSGEGNAGLRGVFKHAVGTIARLKSAVSYRRWIDAITRKFDFETSDFVANYFSPYPPETELLDKRFFKGFETASYGGREYPVPLDVEGYLEHLYGSNWRTPVKRQEASHGEARWKAGH